LKLREASDEGNAEEMSVVELSEVRKHYQLGATRVDALKGITASIEKGEFISIAGPSGSGKTTLLNMIGCMDAPSAGRVVLDGSEVGQMTDGQRTAFRRNRIGFIFQSFNLFPALSVFDNIEFPLLLQRKLPRQEREARVLHFIETVGLWERMRNRPGELSGGQRQRVAIARALVTRPVIVLADEPTANLDSETGAMIVDLMRSINEAEKTTFVFSTHDAQVMQHARRIIKLHDGQISAIEERP
jgi:putative ABC transport system ATP-binding protein